MIRRQRCIGATMQAESSNVTNRPNIRIPQVAFVEHLSLIIQADEVIE
jgi:hypothetical protein